jgi:hypothetical protein
MNPGAIVSCRNREWVLLPSHDSAIYRLRPLTGAIDEVVAVHKGLTNLVGSLLPSERVASATSHCRRPPTSPRWKRCMPGGHTTPSGSG